MKKILLFLLLVSSAVFTQTRFKNRNAGSRFTMFLYQEKSTLSKYVLDYPIIGMFDVLDFDDKWASVQYNGYEGYVILEYIENYKELKMNDKDYLAKLSKEFGSVNAKKILAEKIWLGMTGKMAIKSWGYPEKINKTVNTYGTSEQWIYGNYYLYFKNDKLDSWQETSK